MYIGACIVQGYPGPTPREPDPARGSIFSPVNFFTVNFLAPVQVLHEIRAHTHRQHIDIDRTHKIGETRTTMDVNTAMLLYLRDRYASAAGDLTTLLTRYLNTEVTADSATARFQFLIQEALAAA